MRPNPPAEAGSLCGEAYAHAAEASASLRSSEVHDVSRFLPGRDGPTQGDTAVRKDVPVAVGVVIFFTSFI